MNEPLLKVGLFSFSWALSGLLNSGDSNLGMNASRQFLYATLKTNLLRPNGKERGQIPFNVK